MTIVDDVIIAGFCLLLIVMAALSIRSAYRNGVTDGYGYSREPNCPGYAVAGEYLRSYMGHRWHELNDPCAVGRLQGDLMALIVVAWPNLNPESRALLADWLVWTGQRYQSERPPTTAANRCTLPPSGWACTQPAGHSGPCACWPVTFGLCDEAAARATAEPCCKCGEPYPRADLERGEIYCPKCRVQDGEAPVVLSL